VTAIAVLGAVSFIYIFGHDLITQCKYFQAKRVRVTGTQRLSAQQVLKQVQIHPGINILSVNLSTARKRLMAHSWVAEAEVSRQLPDEITIKIKEHTPIAIVYLGRKFIINTRGEIFKEWTHSDPGGLPIVTGLRYSDINVSGEPRSIPFDAVMNFLKLGKKPGGFLSNRLIKRVHVDREIGLTLHMPDLESDRIKTIKLGYHDYPDKIERLSAILFFLKRDKSIADFDSIDLNNINRIVVNPVGSKDPGPEGQALISPQRGVHYT